MRGNRMKGYDAGNFSIEFFENSALIFRRSDRRFIEVNGTGAAVLNALLENQHREVIVGILSRASELDAETAELDLDRFIASLTSIGLEMDSSSIKVFDPRKSTRQLSV